MYNRIDNTRNVQSNSKYPEINHLYFWHTSAQIDFQQVQQKEYPYQEDGVIKTAEAGKVYVYSKTIKVKGVSKGLTLVSLEHRKTKIKEFFSKAAKEIEKSPDIFLKAQARPVKSGIKYD